MTYDTLIEEFLAYFPEFRGRAEVFQKKWVTEIPVHVFFMTILNPYLDMKLENQNDLPALKQLFAFFELMAQSGDKGVKEVLSDSILEKVGDNKKQIEFARKFMGPSTRMISDSLEKHLGRLNEHISHA